MLRRRINKLQTTMLPLEENYKQRNQNLVRSQQDGKPHSEHTKTPLRVQADCPTIWQPEAARPGAQISA